MRQALRRYSETQGGRDASEADILAANCGPSSCTVRASGARGLHDLHDRLPIDGRLAFDRQPLALDSGLKEEWGFTGILVTDWDNVGRLHWEQRVVPSPKEAAVVAVRCGNDLIMATPSFFEGRAGRRPAKGCWPEAEIDAVLRRILALKFRMGLFENPRRPDRQKQATVIASAEHRALNLELARQSLVLLKNDRHSAAFARLTCEKSRSSAPNADDELAQLGDWSLGSSQHPPQRGPAPACVHGQPARRHSRARAKLGGRRPMRQAARCARQTRASCPAALAACADADVIVLAWATHCRSSARCSAPPR